MNLKEKPSLRPYNTFGIDVCADWLVEYTTINELKRIFATAIGTDHPTLHIGSGSNILFTAPFKGVILHSLIHSIELMEETDKKVVVKVGSGVIWDNFVAHCVEQNWYGTENMSLIPGEVGASAVQNIGAYGTEVKEIIKEVHAFEPQTGNTHIFSNEECQYGYRHSNFKTAWKGKFIITHVVFELSKLKKFKLNYGSLCELQSEECSLANIRQHIITIRQEKLPDPTQWGNAGSYFMNPLISVAKAEMLEKKFPNIPIYPVDEEYKKVSAAWMIEQCGWKKITRPNVGVCPTQSLVIINKGEASPKEIMTFANEIIDSVTEKFEITLTPEVQYI